MRHKLFSGGVSYQDVPFQKKTRFNGDADARLAVTLNVAAKEKDWASDIAAFNMIRAHDLHLLFALTAVITPCNYGAVPVLLWVLVSA